MGSSKTWGLGRQVGLGPRTNCRNALDGPYRLLTTIYNTAVEDRFITHSPCKVKGASQHRNPERPAATVEEIAAATDAMDEPYRLAVPLACYCRLRRSDVLGLQRKHIDLEHSLLRVEQAWTVSAGKMHLGLPKTEEGRRTVQIPANVIPVLVDHRGGSLAPDEMDGYSGARRLGSHSTNARPAMDASFEGNPTAGPPLSRPQTHRLDDGGHDWGHDGRNHGCRRTCEFRQQPFGISTPRSTG